MNLDSVFPSFKPRSQPQNNSEFWTSDKAQDRSTLVQPVKSGKFGGIVARGESIFSSPVGASRSYLNATLSTPPDDMRRGMDPSYAKYPNGVPGLLPDTSTGEDLTVELEESVEDVISGLKLQIETLVTAIMVTSEGNTNSPAYKALQGADAIEVAHRIMCRLRLLREENIRLAQLSNGVMAASLEAEVADLREENSSLKRQIENLQSRKRTVGA